ncbi:YbjN domain-containing protein [Timonella sp. A28]|uniref:YbjN domain-containing protein n=1 Tax=Timonella sp. A28 TaxID=3442640 RepID=UPI003EB75FAD
MSTPTLPEQLTSERIIKWLEDNDLRYFIDSDGDIGCHSANRVYYFLQFGEQREVLQVRGKWNRLATIENANRVLEFCNEWNMKMIWPKAYYRVRDDGQINVYSEVTYDFEFGATTDHIEDALLCGIQTADQLFDELDTVFPDPAQVHS